MTKQKYLPITGTRTFWAPPKETRRNRKLVSAVLAAPMIMT